jgi:hypothetical protein
MPGSSNMVSSRISSMIDRRPAGAGLAFDRALGDRLQRASSVKVSLTSSSSNSRWYCLTSAFFGSVRMVTSAVLVEVGQRGDHRQAADEFRDQAEFQQILGLSS